MTRRYTTFAAALLLRGSAAVAALGAVTFAPRAAFAAEEPEAFARVVVDSAEMRSGPGVSYRVIYTAQRGETLAIDGRQGGGFWLRILLPDGRVAYALGDEVQTFAVSAGEPDAPSRPGLFASPPLEGRSPASRSSAASSASPSPTARRARSATSRPARRSSSTAPSRSTAGSATR